MPGIIEWTLSHELPITETFKEHVLERHVGSKKHLDSVFQISPELIWDLTNATLEEGRKDSGCVSVQLDDETRTTAVSLLIRKSFDRFLGYGRRLVETDFTRTRAQD